MNDIGIHDSIDTFVSILSLTSDEMQDVAQDDSQPYAKRKLIALITSENESIALNTLKWITDQIERQKSELPRPISEQIVTYGKLDYTIAEIIALHPDSATEIKKDWKERKGLYTLYMQGMALGRYEIDSQLQAKAAAGDIKAIETINIRKLLKEK